MMKKFAPISLSVLISLAVIGISYFWATSLMDSMYAYRSPLKNSAPIAGEASGSPLTRSFVIVVIDALRYDTSMKPEVIPFLNQLRTNGAYALMHSRPSSFSESGYTVLLTGAWPDISDGAVLNLDYADIPTFAQDDIYSSAYRADQLTAVSGYNWFEKLIPQGAVTASFYTAGEDQAADRDVMDAALPWLLDGKYNLVLIHLDQVDYAGHHEGGPIDPRWDAAATRVDGLLREITSAMDLTQDTLLIVSDHGQIDQGGHGGQDPIVLLEPFVMVGNGVIPGDYGDVNMVDVAPTIAYGAAIGETVIVQSPDNVLTATQEGMDSGRESRLNRERLPRGIFAIIIVITFINLAAWQSKSYFSWFLIGVVIYTIIFNIKYILIEHKTYSLSSVVDATNLINSTALNTFIALMIAWFVVLLGTNLYKLGTRQAAITTMKFVLTTLSVLSIPLFIHYVINGATVTWTLPDFLTSFLGLLFLIQTLMVAAIGLVLVGFSGLIGLIFQKKWNSRR